MNLNIISKIPKDVKNEVEYKKNSIISKTFLKDEKLNVTIFAVSKGQEFSEHITTSNAIIHIIEGEGDFMLGKKWYKFKESDYFFMEKKLLHAIKATENFKFILYLF